MCMQTMAGRHRIPGDLALLQEARGERGLQAWAAILCCFLSPVCPSPQKKLAAHEAVSIAKSLLPELLMGVLTPEPKPLAADTYLTEEDLFHHQNPRVQVWPWPFTHAVGTGTPSEQLPGVTC